MKKFVTVFGFTSNIQLTKDVGLIPYYLGKEKSFDTKLVTVRMPGGYDYLNNEVKGLNIEFIKKYFNNIFLSEFVYILKNAKNIDILNLYHLNLRTCLQVFFYKHLNKNGFLYLKTDIDNRFFSGKASKNIWKKYVYCKTLKQCNLVTAESKKLCTMLSKYSGCKIEYLPNGFKKRNSFGYTKKKNIIITVGRLGSYQKNTELLVNSFAKLKLKDWKLKLIGGTTDDFKQLVEKLCIKNPELRKNIELTGFIQNKEKLCKLYKEAKIFVLPSRYESFGLVLLEALSEGNYIIVSDSIPVSNDIIKTKKIGQTFANENCESLCNVLKTVTHNTELFTDQNIKKRQIYVESEYNWEKICHQLSSKLLK